MVLDHQKDQPMNIYNTTLSSGCCLSIIYDGLVSSVDPAGYFKALILSNHGLVCIKCSWSKVDPMSQILMDLVRLHSVFDTSSEKKEYFMSMCTFCIAKLKGSAG